MASLTLAVAPLIDAENLCRQPELSLFERIRMHAECEFFLEAAKVALPDFFENVSVLEIGSFDINGSVRKYFSQAKEFVGVDVISGKGVDVVAQGQEISLGREFDVVISTECFEHNPYYKETFANMVRHSRPGGLVLFTCASTGRPEHGTTRTSPADSPGTIELGWDYYRNLEAGDFSYFPFSEAFEGWHFFYNHITHDLYFLAIKKSVDPKQWNAILEKIGTQIVSAHYNIGRNAICPCGSGKRYKHCHGRFS